VLCTGFSYAMTKDKATVLGIDAFLLKPLVAHDLGCTIRQVLAQRKPRT
jgi:hypothetical protein